MKGVERKVFEEGKGGEILSKGDKVIVDLIDNCYDEAKGKRLTIGARVSIII